MVPTVSGVSFAVKHKSAALTTRSSMDALVHEVQLSRWLQVVQSLDSCSSLFCVTINSQLCDQHRVKAVERFASSTLKRYLDHWFRWCEFAGAHNVSIAHPDPGYLLDFLQLKATSLGAVRSRSSDMGRGGFFQTNVGPSLRFEIFGHGANCYFCSTKYRAT